MPHTFTLILTAPAGEAARKIEAEITGQGGQFRGDADRGSFSGKTVLGPVRGTYRRTLENEIAITIEDKPFLVPYGTIEAEIRNYLA